MLKSFGLVVSVWVAMVGVARAEDGLDYSKFPYEFEAVPGWNAEWVWNQRNQDAEATAFLAGGQRDFDRLIEPLVYELPADSDWSWPVPAESLARADALEHPQAIYDLRAAELAELKAWIEENRKADDPVEDWDFEPQIGDWPDNPHSQLRPSVHLHYSGAPYDEVYIVTMQDVENASIPALLSFGGWNANPAPEYHVAALRSWHERYGARLISLTGDVMELRVERRPETREEALDLAREQYAYCNDIVDQGVGDLASLAATLMVSDVWYFWWD